jgi:hypothetical protein
MGLFSKGKEETKNDAPPVPPAAPGTLNAPPAPGVAPMPEPARNITIQAPDEESNNLSAPPIPGGGLEEIKNEVAFKKHESAEKNEETESEEETSTINDEEDSLFDFSELDVNAPINSSDNIKEDIMGNNSEEHKNISDENLSFIKHRHTPSKDTYFVTTSQFKSLLEIIEAVKNKIKDTSETHLKLLDIKAEEDIEFENLRKDFQFIEDKLYEVDSIIFEK